MLIGKGDLVRPNRSGLGLPLLSVWQVTCTSGGLKLFPHNAEARDVHHRVAGLRYKPGDFIRQTLNAVGEWVDECSVPHEVLTERMSSASPSLPTLPSTLFANPDAVTTATFAARQASLASAHYARLLETARKLEAERQQELREAAKAKAKADKEAAKAKAKADKEAAARARVGEARKAMSARLHADRCLALATLALIDEVALLNRGSAERPAPAAIANHADQLQPLARSYGYRIVKPSMVALVVKL